jgi:GTA TIM-barrel-like domain/Putative phage tail protein
VIPRVYGRMRIGGNIIWATDFTETISTTTQGGGKGGGPKVTTTAYLYTASFAVALCEGPITGIGRIWADGKPIDLSGVTWRIYKGDEAQLPDPFIEARMGAGIAPAYRGTAYVMFEELSLEQFGNRIPQLSFEVFRPIVEPDTAEGMVRAVTLIPGTGEFVYAAEAISRGTGGNTASENVHTTGAVPDIIAALDQLQAAAPNIESISLVVSWFGTDLRAGNCQILPGVENTTKVTTPKSWAVNGAARAAAHVISLDASGRNAYGGTPADFAVVQAIQEIKARGLRVTFYPFLLMDIPAGNTLPDPYSGNAATIGQGTYPWRGRITCSPAAGYVGTVDKTTGAGAQISAFMGNAQVANFTVSGEVVSWTGGTDWGYRRMILHYAHLCGAAGGVDTFLIGSELRGLTTIRDGATTYPTVAALKQLAGDVAGILGAGTAISYAADWSEYFGHQPPDGSGDLYYHLDPLWADPNIDFIGIDNYLPLSDWRDGFDHADAQAGRGSIRDLGYLRSNIEGGEGFDWFYASDADRTAQVRTSITDGAERFVLLAPDRSFAETSGATIMDADFGGETTRKSDAAFSAMVPLPASPTDGVLFERGGSGTGMLLALRDGGTVFRYRAGKGNVTVPGVETAILDIPVAAMPFDGQNHELVWDVTLATGTIRLWCDGVLLGSASTTDGGLNSWAGSGSGVYGASGTGATNITGEPNVGWPMSCPNPLFMYDQAITRISGGTDWVFRPKDIRNWWANAHQNRRGGNPLLQLTAWVPQSKPVRFTELGCPAVDRGTNQPNVFYDPKSAESALPYFSRGWQDEAIQRRYLEAMLGYWGEAVNNPTSGVYAAPMIDMDEAAVWTWDARPYPDFPARDDIWTDAPNWRLGHWLNGRLGAVGLGALVRKLCRRAGLADSLIDVSELSDTVPGYVISALESPRASISVLARHFGFDAVESDGIIRFAPRGQQAVSTIYPDDMVASQGDVMELTRGQETELPQALKWQLVRPDEEYDAATVEARRVTVQAARVASDSFPLAVSLEEADRRCRRALMEAWVGRETLTAKLSPSRLVLDPGDVVSLSNNGRQIDYRITRIADAGARAFEAIRTDATIYDLPPGQYRPANLPGATVYGPADVVLMDLPQLDDTVPAHRPYAAVFAKPWYGTAAIWRSATSSGFTLLDTVGLPARMGVLAADLPAGPLWRFDLGNELLVDLTSGTLTSVTDTELFAGANALGVETAPGVWEIVQAGNAELVAAGRYRLTRLLRGQRGTEDAMGNPVAVGARVVLLDSRLQPLSIAEGDLGLPWNWRIGPASTAPSDPLMSAQSFTPSGRGLMPFAPAQLRMRRETNGDLALRWLRRDRALSADSWVLTDVPISEASEAYDVEILSGPAVARTIPNLISPAFTYTAAMQSTDFGGPVISLSVRLYQIGALGRGTPVTQTLTLKESTP